MIYKYSTDEADLRRLLTGRFIAFDTEFSGVSFKVETCPFRSKCHVMSVAAVMPDAVFNVRGFYEPETLVMPRRFLPMLDGIPLFAHNAGVDVHTVLNSYPGLRLLVTDTLSTCRILWPSLALAGGFSLDNIGQRMLGQGKATSYKALMAVPRLVKKKVKAKKVCSCEEPDCRKRGKSHVKLAGQDYEAWIEKGTEELPLTEVKPGHSKWDALVEYAAKDSFLTSALAQRIAEKVSKL